MQLSFMIRQIRNGVVMTINYDYAGAYFRAPEQSERYYKDIHALIAAAPAFIRETWLDASEREKKDRDRRAGYDYNQSAANQSAANQANAGGYLYDPNMQGQAQGLQVPNPNYSEGRGFSTYRDVMGIPPEVEGSENIPTSETRHDPDSGNVND